MSYDSRMPSIHGGEHSSSHGNQPRHSSFSGTGTVFLGALVLLCLTHVITWAAQAPTAIHGVLDLSEWNFAKGHVPLDGEWEFYWAQWIDPDLLAAGSTNAPMYLTVPGSWTEAVQDGHRLPPHGFGTYRLRVLLGEDRGPLSLTLRGVNSAFNLWVNGHEFVRHGVVHSDPKLETPAGGTVVIGVGAGLTELDIVLHVSNHSFRDGGMSSSIVLGDSVRLMVDTERSLTINVVLIASLFVIGLYHLGIWAIRPGFFHALYLGLFCLVLSARISMQDQAPVSFFLTQLSREGMLKVEYLGFYLGGAFIALFLHAMYPNEIRKGPIYALVAVSLAFAAVVLVTPGRINSQLVLSYEIIAVVELLYLIRGLVLAVKRKRHGAPQLYSATVLFFLVFIHDVFYFWGVIRTRALVPIASLALVLAYSLTLAKRFINELERQRILSAQNTRLLQTVSQQVEEIKASRRLMHEREENTRRSLADLLHGSVQSQLLSARHFLQRAMSSLADITAGDGGVETVRDYVERASEQIDRTREDVREISHILHPSLITMGLVPAIRTLLQRFEGTFEMDFRVTGALEATPAADEGIERGIRLVAYRIVEEALNNVVKHAEATTVRIALDVTDDVLTIEVRDDGKGAPPTAVGQGVGLEMIATRVEEVNGSFSFESAPGTGTSVRVTIPLTQG